MCTFVSALCGDATGKAHAGRISTQSTVGELPCVSGCHAKYPLLPTLHHGVKVLLEGVPLPWLDAEDRPDVARRQYLPCYEQAHNRFQRDTFLRQNKCVRLAVCGPRKIRASAEVRVPKMRRDAIQWSNWNTRTCTYPANTRSTLEGKRQSRFHVYM